MDRETRILATKDFFRPMRYKLVPYLCQDGKKHPVAIICPGGGYGMVCSFVEGQPYAKQLNKLGYHAFVVYYRCRSQARYPAPMDDLAHAVRTVLEHAEEWNVDMTHYSVWGSSAGGHLAASFGTDSMGYSQYGLPKPAALILTYPVITMGAQTHIGSRDNLLGKSSTVSERNALSIEKQVTANYPPTFLWCGDADRTVPPENSRMMAAALGQAGIEHEFVVFPGVDHGVGLGEGLACEGWLTQAVEFWQKQMR